MVDREGACTGASREGFLEEVGLETDLEEVRPLSKAVQRRVYCGALWCL